MGHSGTESPVALLVCCLPHPTQPSSAAELHSIDRALPCTNGSAPPPTGAHLGSQAGIWPVHRQRFPIPGMQGQQCHVTDENMRDSLFLGSHPLVLIPGMRAGSLGAEVFAGIPARLIPTSCQDFYSKGPAGP